MTDQPCKNCKHERRYHTAECLIGETLHRTGCTACAFCSYYKALRPLRKVVSSKVVKGGRSRALHLECGHSVPQVGRMYPAAIRARCFKCIPQEERYDMGGPTETKDIVKEAESD